MPPTSQGSDALSQAMKTAYGTWKKTPSTRAIFMWQLYVAIFICPRRWLDKYLLLICVSNNFAKRRCPWIGKEARWRHAGCANVRDFRDWVLQMTKKLSHFMRRVVYTSNFFMWQFLFATKTNTPVFSTCSCRIKIGHFSSSRRANKNCHIKLAL